MELNPKEKAEQLVQDFYNKQPYHGVPKSAYEGAKRSAMLCIDELEKIQLYMYGQDKEFTMYFLEVREEIHSL